MERRPPHTAEGGGDLRRLIMPVLLCAVLLTGGTRVFGSDGDAGSGSTSPGSGDAKKRVVLDNYYNNEWRADSTGVMVRFHYVWHDSTNSGFSILAGIVRRLGAVTDTLCRPPLNDALKDAAVYVIVDPDTPKETAAPAALGHGEVAAIADWVYAGGVLLLLGNDTGNADLQKLSAIAEPYGIRFHENSMNRVVGRAYATGTFDRFPDHPLFRGVRRVFIKELSTLSVTAPAVPLFTNGSDTIIAAARVGKGLVVAVGDPWFYDEYMDARRLPADYDNALAAENLFRWLLMNAR